MKTIAQLVGLPKLKLTPGFYGVEIEAEGVNLPQDLDDRIWRVEQDGSLQNGKEYVMPKPKDMEGVETALNYLQEAYDNCNTTVDESIRAGVHVHMNVQGWDMKRLMTFSVCYYLLEDLLVKYCGPSREGNLFCLRSKDAEFVLFTLLRALEERNLKYLNNDIIRYSSLNFCSLFKYGSLEFRSMRGTGNLDDILTWVKIIDELRTTTEAFSTPEEVLNQFSGDGEISFIRNLLPTYHHLFTEMPDAAKSVRDGARRVQMIAFGINWKDIEKANTNIFLGIEGF